MDSFCLKQFNTEGGGQHTIIPGTADEFVRRTNEWYEKSGESALVGGYAPFCKHLFIPASHYSFPTPLSCAYAPITEENKNKLETAYVARTDKELPVLTRFFPKGSATPSTATYIDVILYSRDQIAKENAAMAAKAPVSTPTSQQPSAGPALSAELSSASTADRWQWGIVSIKPQDVDYETPMNPITVMRNALGVEEGGSGIPLNREAYMKSVEFWSKHALVQ